MMCAGLEYSVIIISGILVLLESFFVSGIFTYCMSLLLGKFCYLLPSIKGLMEITAGEIYLIQIDML